MSTPINIKTFLLGDTPKNNPLTIQEMDQNLLNLKGAIQSVEDSTNNLITTAINTESIERQAADNSERDFRIAGDAALDSRLDVVESSYVKKDGTVTMTGPLTLSPTTPVNQYNAASKIYVDKASPEFYDVVTLTGNLTLSSVNFLITHANTLYVFPNTALSSLSVTLPNPSSVQVGSKVHFYNQYSNTSRSLTVAAPTNTIKGETTTTGTQSSFIVYAGKRVTFVSDGTLWIPYRHYTRQLSTYNWDAPLHITNVGDMWGGKNLTLKSSSTSAYDPNSVDFSINTDGTKLNISSDGNNSNILFSIDRTTGKVFQDSNAPVTSANQLVPRDYIDKYVISESAVTEKVITSTHIQSNKDVSKPQYPSLSSSDFGKIVRYRMTSKGVVYTSLPAISSLTGSKRIKLINISCDSLPQAGDTYIPGFAINAAIRIFPFGSEKIVGAAVAGVFAPSGMINLEAGDSVELVAVNSTEWMIVSHSSVGLPSRLGVNPYNRLMFICRIRANGTIDTYGVNDSPQLWTRPDNLLGNGAGIVVSVSKPGTGNYTITWENPNYWAEGQTLIQAPMVYACANFTDSEPANLGYVVKAQSLDGNSCNVVIKNSSTLSNVDAPFTVMVYGGDV